MELNEENNSKMEQTTTETIVSICTTYNLFRTDVNLKKNSTDCLWHVSIIYCHSHCCKVHLCNTCQLTFILVYVKILDFNLPFLFCFGFITYSSDFSFKRK